MYFFLKLHLMILNFHHSINITSILVEKFLIGFDVYVFVLHFDIFFLSKLFCSRVKVPKSFFCIDFCNKLVIFIRGIQEYPVKGRKGLCMFFLKGWKFNSCSLCTNWHFSKNIIIKPLKNMIGFGLPIRKRVNFVIFFQERLCWFQGQWWQKKKICSDVHQLLQHFLIYGIARDHHQRKGRPCFFMPVFHHQ